MIEERRGDRRKENRLGVGKGGKGRGEAVESGGLRSRGGAREGEGDGSSQKSMNLPLQLLFTWFLLYFSFLLIPAFKPFNIFFLCIFY